MLLFHVLPQCVEMDKKWHLFWKLTVESAIRRGNIERIEISIAATLAYICVYPDTLRSLRTHAGNCVSNSMQPTLMVQFKNIFIHIDIG